MKALSQISRAARVGATGNAVCRRSGFTLTELLIAAALFGLITAGAISVYLMCHQRWHAVALNMLAARNNHQTMARLVYGFGTNNGLRAAASISYSSNAHGWRLTVSNAFDGLKWMDFNRQASNLYWVDSATQSNRLCANVIEALVSTNNLGLNIALTVQERKGARSATNRIDTFILMRNRK